MEMKNVNDLTPHCHIFRNTHNYAQDVSRRFNILHLYYTEKCQNPGDIYSVY